MMDPAAPARRTGESWDTYWRGALDPAAYTGTDSDHPHIEAYWLDVFRALHDRCRSPRVVDIGSGAGAVAGYAVRVYADHLPDFTCIDESAAAAEQLQRRFPGIGAVVADACDVPLQSAAFDLVTSQFGVEYAGPRAFDEAARLVADGGRLVCLLHHRGGCIYAQCAADLDAIRAVQEARFIRLAMSMLEAGFAAASGADRAAYDTAAGDLAPAVEALEAIMTRHGPHVAGDMVRRLYDGVASIHERMPQYVPQDVLDWLGLLESELDAYAGRMASMCAAAASETQLRQRCSALEARGLRITRAEPLNDPAQALPLAWALAATRE